MQRVRREINLVMAEQKEGREGRTTARGRLRDDEMERTGRVVEISLDK